MGYMGNIIFYLTPSELDKAVIYNIQTNVDVNNSELVCFISSQFLIVEENASDLLVVSNSWWRTSFDLHERIHILLYPEAYLWGYSHMLSYECLTQLPELSQKIGLKCDRYFELNKDFLTFLQISAKDYVDEIRFCSGLLRDQSSVDLYNSLIYSDVNVLIHRYIDNIQKWCSIFSILIIIQIW